MTHVQDFPEQVSGVAARAAINRLAVLARSTVAQLGAETAAGGEPCYPTWIADVLLIERYAGQADLN